MNQEQKAYISLINESSEESILIKKTGWEEISLSVHTHQKHQIIYTLSGTLHIQINEANYFVPEKHIAWIPSECNHILSSNNRRVSLVIFYLNLPKETGKDPYGEFSVYSTHAVVAENLRFIASKGPFIERLHTPDLYDFAISFFRLLPTMNPHIENLLKTKVIPNDERIRPVLEYLIQHAYENLKIEEVAERFSFSVRNLSRLLHDSGIHFNRYLNQQRITRAIELFADGKKSIQEVAYEVGFNTPNNFNRVFKQLTGMTPKNYGGEITKKSHTNV